jgi:hypothetical protein
MAFETKFNDSDDSKDKGGGVRKSEPYMDPQNNPNECHSTIIVSTAPGIQNNFAGPSKYEPT